MKLCLTNTRNFSLKLGDTVKLCARAGGVTLTLAALAFGAQGPSGNSVGGLGAVNFQETIWDITVDGPQFLSLPLGTIKTIGVYLNGVRQRDDSYVVSRGNLVLPAEFQVTAGDVVTAEIII